MLFVFAVLGGGAETTVGVASGGIEVILYRKRILYPARL